MLRRRGVAAAPGGRLRPDEVRTYAQEFYRYSAPLFAYALLGLVVALLDRWLLQYVAGAADQGFFTLAFQIATICFLFTGALTPLLMREFARAHAAGDVAGMRELFLRYVPLLYSVSAYFAVFAAVEAERIVLVIGGEAFRGAALPVALMALYPIHQTYGQLSGSLFYATGRTRLYSVIGMGLSLASLPLTLWLLGPARLGALDLGATGLAAKMIAIQFVGVQVQLWFNARMLRTPFLSLLAHQAVAVAALAAVAWLAARVTGALTPRPLAAVVVSGVLYTAGVAALAWAAPGVLGTDRASVRGLVGEVRARAGRGRTGGAGEEPPGGAGG